MCAAEYLADPVVSTHWKFIAAPLPPYFQLKLSPDMPDESWGGTNHIWGRTTTCLTFMVTPCQSAVICVLCTRRLRLGQIYCGGGVGGWVAPQTTQQGVAGTPPAASEVLVPFPPLWRDGPVYPETPAELLSPPHAITPESIPHPRAHGPSSHRVCTYSVPRGRACTQQRRQSVGLRRKQRAGWTGASICQ